MKIEEQPKRGLVIVISGPSCGGKTTLATQLLAADPNITRAITCTTRAPRQGEVDGVDYHFLTLERFQELLATGAFIEHANVYGNDYGTLKATLINTTSSGKDVLLVVDVQGANTICEQAAKMSELAGRVVSVFLSVETDVLRQRFQKRGKDAPAVIERRLQTAESELRRKGEFDHIIPSGNPENDHTHMQAILDAERRLAVENAALQSVTDRIAAVTKPVGRASRLVRFLQSKGIVAIGGNGCQYKHVKHYFSEDDVHSVCIPSGYRDENYVLWMEGSLERLEHLLEDYLRDCADQTLYSHVKLFPLLLLPERIREAYTLITRYYSEQPARGNAKEFYIIPEKELHPACYQLEHIEAYRTVAAWLTDNGANLATDRIFIEWTR